MFYGPFAIRVCACVCCSWKYENKATFLHFQNRDDTYFQWNTVAPPIFICERKVSFCCHPSLLGSFFLSATERRAWCNNILRRKTKTKTKFSIFDEPWNLERKKKWHPAMISRPEGRLFRFGSTNSPFWTVNSITSGIQWLAQCHSLEHCFPTFFDSRHPNQLM